MNLIGCRQIGQRGGVDDSDNMPKKIGPLTRRANSGDIHKEQTAPGTHRVGAACHPCEMGLLPPQIRLRVPRTSSRPCTMSTRCVALQSVIR